MRMTQTFVAAALGLVASVSQAGVNCPAGSVKVVECETKNISFADCHTSLDGSAIVSSSGLFARSSIAPEVGAMKAVRGLTRGSGIVELRYFPNSGTQPGEVVLAGEKLPAKCTVP